METKKNAKYIKIIMILLALEFTIPSILYLLKGNKLLAMNPSFSFFYTNLTKGVTSQRIFGAVAFLCLFLGLMGCYCWIIKRFKKLEETPKKIAFFILGIAILFTIQLPMTSSDVFYYIGTGWNEAHYGANPYYQSVEQTMLEKEEAKEDPLLQKTPGIWQNSTVVYGPLWTFLCKILSGLSFGNLTLALFNYKIFNLLLHLLNCYLVYQLFNKKLKNVAFYGLNPFILFEGLANAHNDLLVITLVLLAIYMLQKRKKILPMVIGLAIATAVKYYAVLLVPFLMLVIYRKETILNRISKCFSWAILFILTLLMCYLPYLQDHQIWNAVFIQQDKMANSIGLLISVESSYSTALWYKEKMTMLFIFLYIFSCGTLLLEGKSNCLRKNIKKYQNLLLLFIFGVITNFQSWYLLWLVPTIFFLPKRNRKSFLKIITIVQIVKTIFFILGESYQYQTYYVIIVATLILLSHIQEINNKIIQYKEKGMQRKNGKSKEKTMD